MVFCNKKSIPEEDRAPASHILLLSFVSTLTGAYSGSTISNYLYGVRAWHILHGVPWQVEKPEMEVMLKAAEKVTPPSSRRKKQHLYTIKFITTIRQQLDLSKPLDTSVFACLTTCFFRTGHVGEFTVPRLESFDAETHVSRAGVSHDQTREGQKVTMLHIPCTKTAHQGEDACWAKQDGLADPKAALSHHLEVNNPSFQGHLFAYRHKNGHWPLTKSKFIGVLAKAARAAGGIPRSNQF